MRLSNHSDPLTSLLFLDHFKIEKKPPSFIFLSEIVDALGNLPYENLTKIVACAENQGPKLRLPHEVWGDFVRYGAGGTCFSLTFFAWYLLNNLGFVAYPVMADRRYGTNTHCALIVDLNERKYLVDPGFLIGVPIDMAIMPTVHPTGFNFILLQKGENDSIEVSTRHNNQTKWRYRIKTSRVSWADFEKFWMDSFCFRAMKSLIITLRHQDSQIYLHDDSIRITTSLGQEKQSVNEALPSSFRRFFDSSIYGKAKSVISK